MMEANIAPIIAAVAAASAAATAKRNNEKEEVMARYNSDDLNGWEFKIVRANTRKFRKQESLLIKETVQKAADAIRSIMREGVEKAKNKYHA